MRYRWKLRMNSTYLPVGQNTQIHRPIISGVIKPFLPIHWTCWKTYVKSINRHPLIELHLAMDVKWGYYQIIGQSTDVPQSTAEPGRGERHLWQTAQLSSSDFAVVYGGQSLRTTIHGLGVTSTTGYQVHPIPMDYSTISINSTEGCVTNCRAKFLNSSDPLPFARSPANMWSLSSIHTSTSLYRGIS